MLVTNQFINKKSFSPNKHYINLDFDASKIKIREALADQSSEDFGSLFLATSNNFWFTINHLGYVDIHYADLSLELVKRVISKIETIIKDSISGFRLVEKQ